MTREIWTAWKEKTFGSEYMIWHDGLYVGAVTALAGREREEALEMLRLGVSLGDDHAGEALAAMGDAASVAAMREQLANASGTARVRLALAVHALTPDPSLASHLVEVLRSNDHWSVRIDAAIGLREFSGDPDEGALLQAVEGSRLPRPQPCVRKPAGPLEGETAEDRRASRHLRKHRRPARGRTNARGLRALSQGSRDARSTSTLIRFGACPDFGQKTVRDTPLFHDSSRKRVWHAT